MLIRHFFVYLLLFAGESIAQGTDILLLKKSNGRTIKTYVAGSFIEFRDISGRNVTGVIRRLERDTLFISYYDVRQGYTMWGTTMADTLSAYLMKYHYKEIAAIKRDTKTFQFVRDGTLFIIGGVAYALLHSVNAAIKKEPVDGKTLAIAGGVAVTGFVMRKLQRKNYVLGRHFSLHYIGLK